MDALTQQINEIQRAIESGRRCEAQALALELSEQWPDSADGWLLRSWLSDEPIEALRFAQRAARLEAGSPSVTDSVRWSREWLHTFVARQPKLPQTPRRLERRAPYASLFHRAATQVQPLGVPSMAWAHGVNGWVQGLRMPHLSLPSPSQPWEADPRLLRALLTVLLAMLLARVDVIWEPFPSCKRADDPAAPKHRFCACPAGHP